MAVLDESSRMTLESRQKLHILGSYDVYTCKNDSGLPYQIPTANEQDVVRACHWTRITAQEWLASHKQLPRVHDLELMYHASNATCFAMQYTCTCTV